LTPLAPSKIPIIRCIGLNYKEHAKETSKPIPKFPILFIKPSTSLQNPFDKIRVPTIATNNQVDYEAELAVLIGKDCKDVNKDNALQYVLGYTVANDVSARKWQGIIYLCVLYTIYF
jgi:2-keto-4-pentenoate hydratase/2-oxohepta-3-ene-1,7-dioic acid hydratase in catechol pathway